MFDQEEAFLGVAFAESNFVQWLNNLFSLPLSPPLLQDYNDEIRQAQLQELTYLNGGSENAEVPVVRGKPSIRARGVPVPALSR